MEISNKFELTDFDSVVSAKQLQIMKAAIPYIPVSEQKFLSIYVKISELMNTVNLINQPEAEEVGICSIPQESRNPAQMLNAVKDYCNDKEKEMIDLMFNLISASSLYSNYRSQNIDKISSTSSSNSPLLSNELMSSLKKMLTPEQQTMFETYSSLLSTLS